ncbi:TadE family protein [Aquipseudomonas guryensis]|uniref:Pilus assembly protein n=1 Tax=Aquipseudomonas guryensis TaxID=2759165 RepID=A0A7W4DEJ8_9GAMM|nr:TadE family protein [Pseudomonas guryensis]MBB1521161.1 pilus assembly protein [Pseudomonas guryensis]
MRGRKQSGQAMVEYLIVLPALIMLIFGTIQAAFIYSAKNSLNYATFQAARLGAVNNASYDGIRRGLIRGLTPMFIHHNTDADKEQANIEAGAEVDNYVRITRISPTLSDFSAFAEFDSDESDYLIPNDNLMYRPATGIQDANLLKIRVQYCLYLVVPIVDRLLSAASSFNNANIEGSFSGASQNAVPGYTDICQAGRRGIVITSEATVRMQSPALRDSEACGTDMQCL